MQEKSPLDLLLGQIRWAEAQRQTAEEELNRTPNWRFRQRAKRRRRLDRRLAAKQQGVALAAELAEGSLHHQATAVEKSDD